MHTLPLFQYPIATAWVDDDKDFLDTIKKIMPIAQSDQYFSTSEDCLKFFREYVNPLSKIEFLFPERGNENYGTQEHLPVDFNISSIFKLKDINERNEEIGILICDYKMPNINGIELCHKLKELHLKKILLTGEAQGDNAVSAFNDDSIDRFVKKDGSSLPEEIRKHINTLTRQYFCEITAPLLSYLESDTPSPLTDKIFVRFFDDWCKTNEIKEFYLLDKNGSFFAIDYFGKQHFFIVHTEKSLDNFIAIYSDIKQENHLLDDVKSRGKIPFFGQGTEAWQINFNEWEKYFYEPRMLVGREKYYIANIENCPSN